MFWFFVFCGRSTNQQPPKATATTETTAIIAVEIGSVFGGSAPVLIVGCGVKVGIADGMPKLGISKSVIGLTKGW